MKFLKVKLFFGLFIVLFLLTGCGGGNGFKKGNIKDDFCGAYINFQFCKCAFHNEYCEQIGMKKSEANKYVNEEYNKWVDREFEVFKTDCLLDNGIVKGKKCVKCEENEVSENGKCLADEEKDVVDSEEEVVEDDDGEEKTEGVCRYDSDCDAICEGNVMWKMGCNARTDTCEKTFDTDCSADVENFGELSFAKVCASGECVRDIDGIEQRKAELTQEIQVWTDAGKKINSVRGDINIAMLDANKNCINGIADMTNVAIMEFSTRIASVLAGGIPDIAAMTATAAEKASGLMLEHVKNLAGAATDYAGEALGRLYNYQSGEPVEAEKKLAPHEYIKLNCDLYEYFKKVEVESATDLETAINNAKVADEKLKELP